MWNPQLSEGVSQASRNVKRARLVAVPTQFMDRASPNVTAAIEGVLTELERKCFVPLSRVATVEALEPAFRDTFTVFCELWQAVVSLLASSIEEHDVGEHHQRVVEDLWRTKTAERRIGILACANFEHALLARTRLAQLALRVSTNPKAAKKVEGIVDTEELVRLTLGADYLTMFGLFVVARPRPLKLSREVTEALSAAAVNISNEAWELLAAPFYRDTHDHGENRPA